MHDVVLVGCYLLLTASIQLFYWLYDHRKLLGDKFSPTGINARYFEMLEDSRKMGMETGDLASVGSNRSCHDSDVLCGLDERWRDNRPSEWGQLYPPWKHRPPKFPVFNLCEPFGDGNVVSEMMFEGSEGSNLHVDAGPLGWLQLRTLLLWQAIRKARHLRRYACRAHGIV